MGRWRPATCATHATLAHAFEDYDPGAVMHFAASSLVRDPASDPAEILLEQR